MIVIKYGGAAMQSPDLVKSTMQDVQNLHDMGWHPVIVHGGGQEISKMCEKVGLTSSFVNGLRVTDKETLEITQMVLIGKVNKELVSCLNQTKNNAVGLSGIDGGLLIAKPEDPGLGFVGKIEQVNPAIIYTLIQANYIPVIAPIASSHERQHYNVNADIAASAIAIALKASHLVLLTDVPGILINSTKIDKLCCADIPALINNKTLYGGMIPKVTSASEACQKGVGQVHLIDGRKPHALLHHIQNIETLGTTLYV